MQDNTQSRRAFIGVITASIVGALVPSVANAQINYGETSQSEGRSLSSGQEFPLTVLIGQLASQQDAIFLTNQAYKNGATYIAKSSYGGDAYHWLVPVAFTFNPNLQWLAASWDNLLIATQWSMFGNSVNRQQIAAMENYLRTGIGSSGSFNAALVNGTWYAMVIASASVSFTAELTSMLSKSLRNRTFPSYEKAQMAVQEVVDSVGFYRLIDLFRQHLNNALNDSYLPLPGTGDYKNTKTLTAFQTMRNGTFRYVEGKGWEKINGIRVFSAGDGVIDGAISKIAIGSSRESTFTTKDKGVK